MESVIANITAKLPASLDRASEESASISIRAEQVAEVIRKGALEDLRVLKWSGSELGSGIVMN